MQKLDLTQAYSVSHYEDPQTGEVHIDFEFDKPNLKCAISIRGENFKEALFNAVDYIVK